VTIELIHGKNYEEQGTLIIKVNGKGRINAFPGEPEDFSLERDLNFVYDIIPLMQEAYEAGKKGEELKVEKLPEEA